MEPRISLVTLDASDLSRAHRCSLAGLGWPLSSATSGESAFFLTGGVAVAR